MTNEEIFTMIGIIEYDNMYGTIDRTTLQLLLTDGLHLGPLWDPLCKVLESRARFFDKYEIQTMFRAIDSNEFLNKCSGSVNGFDIITNVHMMKVAMFLFVQNKLNLDDLKAAILSYRIVEMNYKKLGMKRDIGLVIETLRSIDRYISKKKLKFWMAHNEKRFRAKGKYLMPDEYFFIIPNCDTRIKEVNKLPSNKISLHKLRYSQTWRLETALTHSRQPDEWLGKVQENKEDFNTVRWQYEWEPAKQREIERAKQQPRPLTDKEQFQQLLQNPKLFREIKQTLKQANKLVSHHKHNEDYDFYDSPSTPMLAKTAEFRMKGLSMPRLYQPQRPSARDVREKFHMSQSEANFKNKEDIRLMRPGSAYVKKHRPMKVNDKVTCLDLGINTDPFHVLSLREIATLDAQNGQLVTEDRTWVSSKPTKQLEKHLDTRRHSLMLEKSESTGNLQGMVDICSRPATASQSQTRLGSACATRPGTARVGSARPGTAKVKMVRPGTAKNISLRPSTAARPESARTIETRPGTARPVTAQQTNRIAGQRSPKNIKPAWNKY